MLGRPPANGPYRDGDAPDRLPPSPDIDPSLLASSRTTPLLVITGFWVPAWLLLTWLTDMDVRGCGPTHAQTSAEKIGVTVVLTLLIAVLVAFRVRHGRRQSAALRALSADGASAGAGLRAPRGDLEEAKVRVNAAASAPASDAALANESEIALEPGRHRQKGD